MLKYLVGIYYCLIFVISNQNIMEIQFKDYTTDEINLMCDTNITPEMTFSEVVDELDRTENRYFYISLNDEDVIEAVNNEIEIAEQLGLWFAHIIPQGVCVALYQ